MTAGELIKQLKEMPQDAEVLHLWDGGARTGIELVWLSLRGDVITSDYHQVCYDTDVRPVGAPTEEEVCRWYTQASPRIDESLKIWEKENMEKA